MDDMAKSEGELTGEFWVGVGVELDGGGGARGII